MNTKRFLIPGLIVSLVVLGAILLLQRGANQQQARTDSLSGASDSATIGDDVPVSAQQSGSSADDRIKASPSPATEHESLRMLVTQSQMTPEQAQQAMLHLYAGQSARVEDVRKDIVFYGRVMDERERPVAGADISFTWNEPLPDPPQESRATSDEDGKFSLAVVTGRNLRLAVEKAGHYVSRKYRHLDLFFVHDAEPFANHLTPDNPMVIRLRTKGPGTDLVTSQHGMMPEMEFSLPADGSPVRVDFFRRKVGNEGQMELSAIKPRRGEPASSWTIRLSIPGGGLIEHDDEFPFEAPESGYQPVIQLHFEAGQPGWTEVIRKEFYVAFGHPRHYGRIRLDTGLKRGVYLGYAVNPDGSRYLEPKQPSP